MFRSRICPLVDLFHLSSAHEIPTRRDGVPFLLQDRSIVNDYREMIKFCVHSIFVVNLLQHFDSTRRERHWGRDQLSAGSKPVARFLQKGVQGKRDCTPGKVGEELLIWSLRAPFISLQNLHNSVYMHQHFSKQGMLSSNKNRHQTLQRPRILRDLFFSAESLLRSTWSINKDRALGRPNYSFQKRQKELAKKKKQTEKKQRRLEKRENPAGEEDNPSLQED